MIRFGEPVCVILGMILHFFDPADAPGIVAALLCTVAPGSFLILSIGVNNETPDLADRFGSAYDAATVHAYDRNQVAQCFAGLELVEPGLVQIHRWRPDETNPDDAPTAHGGVGRKVAPA